VKLLREVCHSKKSKFTAPLIVGCEETVPYGDFIDKALQLLVDDSADGVRWDKVARIKGALANGTYDVSAEDLAGRIVGSKGAEAQVALHARAFDHWSSLKQCLMRLSKRSWLRL
jgi:Anti-sigma-28 factor, FlgM